MTMQNRFFVSPQDVLSVHITCTACGATMALPVGAALTEPSLVCINAKCRKELLEHASDPYRALQEIAASMRTLRAKLPFTTSIEVKGN